MDKCSECKQELKLKLRFCNDICRMRYRRNKLKESRPLKTNVELGEQLPTAPDNILLERKPKHTCPLIFCKEHNSYPRVCGCCKCL